MTTEYSNIRKRFPKVIPSLSPSEQIVCDDFMKTWHEELKKRRRYDLLERFNHGFSVNSKHLKKLKEKKSRIKTIELGCGLGTHIKFEDLSFQEYYAVELRDNMISSIKESFPEVIAIQGDIQGQLDFSDNFFDRCVVVHVLEHLPNLPACIDTVHRLLTKKTGIFQVVLPCDPGLLYEFCRSISARRLFEKKYNLNYDVFIKREHINSPNEILGIIEEKFEIVEKKYFPTAVPFTDINLCIGVTAKKR